MIGSLIPDFRIYNVGMIHVDVRVDGWRNENPIEAGILLLPRPEMSPEMIPGILEEDVAKVGLGFEFTHQHREWRSLAGVVEVAVNHNASIWVLFHEGFAVFPCEPGFVEPNLGLIEVLHFPFGLKVKTDEVSESTREFDGGVEKTTSHESFESIYFIGKFTL